MPPREFSPAGRDFGSIVIAVIAFLIGGCVLYATTAMTAMGAVFPRTVAIIMMVAAILLIVSKLLRPGGDAVAGAGGSRVRRAALISVLLAWSVLFPRLGFVVTSFAGFVAICFIADHDPPSIKRFAAYMAVGLVLVVGAWQLLSTVLNVPFPRGLLI